MDKSVDDINSNFIDDFYVTIGNNVKKQREKKGYSQLKLSQLMGHKSVGLVSQAEIYLNKQHFNLAHLYKLAYILECNMEDFFEGISIPK